MVQAKPTATGPHRSSSTSKENRRGETEQRKLHVNSTRIEGSEKETVGEDELTTLNKLSMLNAGARYELLSINKQLLDFDISMKAQKRINNVE